MMRLRFGSLVFVVLLVRPAASEAAANPDDPPGGASNPDKAPAERLEQFKKAAARYQIERHTEPPVTLELRADPVLRWNSPLRTAYDGAVFVWTADGRPEVVASFYRNVRDGVPFENHEFQSLSASPLTASYAGSVVWDAREAGLTMAPIPNAPAPAASAPARLRQMRVLAGEFRAEINGRAGASPLRLLNQPLYRDESGRSDPLDGALFGYVHATDPEVLLRVEARSTGGGAPAWHYGFARMSSFTLRAFHKDQMVWEVRGLKSTYKNIPAPEQPR